MIFQSPYFVLTQIIFYVNLEVT